MKSKMEPAAKEKRKIADQESAREIENRPEMEVIARWR